MERLKRKYNSFSEYVKKVSNGVSIPVEIINVSRPALKTTLVSDRYESSSSVLATNENEMLKIHRDNPNEPSPFILPSSESSAWPDFGTEASRHKENTEEPSVWAGKTLKQKKSLVAKNVIAPIKIDIYNDNEEELNPSTIKGNYCFFIRTDCIF